MEGGHSVAFYDNVIDRTPNYVAVCSSIRRAEKYGIVFCVVCLGMEYEKSVVYCALGWYDLIRYVVERVVMQVI